jgi:hypothetical protein
MVEVLRGLYSLATSKTESSAIRIAASRELLNRAYGLPKAHLDIEHGISESAVELLTRIAVSPEHRRNVEWLEARRLRLAAITVESETDKSGAAGEPVT